MDDATGWRVRKRPLGQPTRGKTASERLRRLDAFLAAEEAALLRRPGAAPFVDVGFGEDPRTTIEAAARFRVLHPALRVVGVEIDRDRVAAAQALGLPDIEIVHGGFEGARTLGEPARLIRAMNVLRQYGEDDVVPAWRAMGRALQEGGLLVEGTSDPLGRLLVVHRLRRTGEVLTSEGVLFLARNQGLEDVRDFQAVLPKRLIHRVTPGEPAFGFFEDWSAAWRETSGAPRRFPAAGARLAERRADVSAPPRWLRRGALLWRLAFAVPLAGCAAPEALPGTEPAIKLIYPSGDVVVPALVDDEGCHARFFVAVDFLNVVFRPPADAPGDDGSENVLGEAHWHIWLNGIYYGAPDELADEVAIDSQGDDAACPTAVELRVNLARNDHEDLDGDGDQTFPDWEQSVTVTLQEP